MSPKLLNSLLLVASAVLYFYVIEPLYFGSASSFFDNEKSIPMLVQKRNSYDMTIAAFPDLLKKAKTNVEQYNSITEEDKRKIMTLVPTSVDEIKLMSELTNIGNASGVQIDGMGIKDKGGSYSINFSITTTYTNFKEIMRYWGSSSRLFALQSVSFTPGKTEDDLIKFNIELVTYYMK
jgi:hypothetical protein